MVMYLTCKFQIATCPFTSSILDDPNQTPNPISGPERGPVDRRIWKSGRQVESQDPVPAPNAGIRLSSRGMLGILMKKERERESSYGIPGIWCLRIFRECVLYKREEV